MQCGVINDEMMSVITTFTSWTKPSVVHTTNHPLDLISVSMLINQVTIFMSYSVVRTIILWLSKTSGIPDDSDVSATWHVTPGVTHLYRSCWPACVEF